MKGVFIRFCLLALAASLFAARVPVCAVEAEDEESIAKREKEARDKADAAKKGNSVAPKGDDDPDAIDISKLAPKQPDSNPFKPADAAKPPASGIPAIPTDPAKPAPPSVKPAAPVKPANAAPAIAVCPECKGMGIVPNLPYKPYIKFEGQAPPVPDFPAQWHYCEKCQKGKDAKEIIEDMKDQQARGIQKHAGLEAASGKKLALFETPFVTVHSQLPPGVNKTMVNALEKCAGILINNSHTMVLMAARAGDDTILALLDKPSYETYIDAVMAGKDKSQIELAKKGVGLSSPQDEVFYMATPGPPAESHAVFALGGLVMHAATNNKAKPWVTEGFCSYCENVTLGTNLNSHFAYEEPGKEKVSIKGTWNEAMKKFLKDGKLKKWTEIFEIDLSHMKPIEYLTCYSVISFLIRSDPARFDHFVLLLKEGEDSGPAIEKAYGRKITELQSIWVQWLQTQK